jgi:hypothetical protein
MLHTVQGGLRTLCTPCKGYCNTATHPALKAGALKLGAQLRAFAGYGSLARIQQPRLFDALIESVPCLHQERAAARQKVIQLVCMLQDMMPWIGALDWCWLNYNLR